MASEAARVAAPSRDKRVRLDPETLAYGELIANERAEYARCREKYVSDKAEARRVARAAVSRAVALDGDERNTRGTVDAPISWISERDAGEWRADAHLVTTVEELRVAGYQYEVERDGKGVSFWLDRARADLEDRPFTIRFSGPVRPYSATHANVAARTLNAGDAGVDRYELNAFLRDAEKTGSTLYVDVEPDRIAEFFEAALRYDVLPAWRAGSTYSLAW